VKFSFRLDRSGHVTRLKVSSSKSNRFVEQTTIQIDPCHEVPAYSEESHRRARPRLRYVDSEINIDRH